MNTQTNNRKLENQAKHKQMLHALGKFQEKIESMAELTHINEEAYLQLCNGNMELYNTINKLFKEIIEMKEMYETTIMNNTWTRSYTDVNYHSRQAKTRSYKINNPDYQLCPCGDWISKYSHRVRRNGTRRLNPRAMIEHQKTEKCMSNRARIRWNDTDKCKLCKVPGMKIDKFLHLNSHINSMANEEQPKLSGREALRMLLIRRRIRNL